MSFDIREAKHLKYSKAMFFRKLKCLIQCTQNVPYAKRKIVSTCFKARFLESRDVHTTAVHCDKLNSRMPSIASLIEWINLQSFFKRNIWDKRIKIDKNFFLSLTDVKKEGNWTDYNTDGPKQHAGSFWPGEPNGRERQNCVMQFGNGWFDV